MPDLLHAGAEPFDDFNDDEYVEDEGDWATFCSDCEATFDRGDEGWGWDECFECGSSNVYEIGVWT